MGRLDFVGVCESDCQVFVAPAPPPPEPRMTSERQETPDFEQADAIARAALGLAEQGDDKLVLRGYRPLASAYLALRATPRAGSASKERGFREWPCGCSWNNGLVTRCAAHPPRAGEVTLTFSTGDSSVHLLAAAANIINGEMELMDVDNFTMQVKYRNYKRVRDALTAALAASRQERGT